jgi:hypothetical protein
MTTDTTVEKQLVGKPRPARHALLPDLRAGDRWRVMRGL